MKMMKEQKKKKMNNHGDLRIGNYLKMEVAGLKWAGELIAIDEEKIYLRTACKNYKNEQKEEVSFRNEIEITKKDIKKYFEINICKKLSNLQGKILYGEIKY